MIEIGFKPWAWRQSPLRFWPFNKNQFSWLPGQTREKAPRIKMKTIYFPMDPKLSSFSWQNKTSNMRPPSLCAAPQKRILQRPPSYSRFSFIPTLSPRALPPNRPPSLLLPNHTQSCEASLHCLGWSLHLESPPTTSLTIDFLLILEDPVAMTPQLLRFQPSPWSELGCSPPVPRSTLSSITAFTWLFLHYNWSWKGSA